MDREHSHSVVEKDNELAKEIAYNYNVGLFEDPKGSAKKDKKKKGIAGRNRFHSIDAVSNGKESGGKVAELN